MDSKSINFFSKKASGFFLTSGRETDANKAEFALFHKVAELGARRLFEHKVRSFNVHSHWTKMYEISYEMETLVFEEIKGNETLEKSFNEDGSALAWCFGILFAALGQYNAIVQNRKTTKKD